ncbi:MAG: tryptophan--tRNA ligase [Anaerolineae bacterium]|nr:tryptophan--tRNA ligase [Anaerolineae bacterium]
MTDNHQKKKGRILTGDRPTGKFHLGHYVGTLRNRVKLQDEYDTFLLIADYHSLTTHPEKADVVRTRANIREAVLANYAAGVDPDKVTYYVQSDVPETAELTLLFAMLVTVPRLERIPTLKDVMRDQHIEQPSSGLMNYPVLQAADILAPRADLVPVGKDQESHVELTREIARRFNNTFGAVFPEPQALIGDVATLVGTDGQAKMSKSLGNAIFLDDDPDAVKQKVFNMYTDPKRIRADVPGTVEGNPVFIYHDAFNPNKEEVDDLKDRYRKGKVGDVEVKQKLTVAINNFLEPFRARRAYLEARPDDVIDILRNGLSRARPIAQETLTLAREAMGLTSVVYPSLTEMYTGRAPAYSAD